MDYLASDEISWGMDLPVPQEAICANVVANLARGVPRISLLAPHDLPFVFLGGGPSLNLDDAVRHGGRIFTSGQTLAYALDNGVRPWGYVNVDPKPKMAGYLEPRPRDVRYFVSSASDPSVFEALEGFNVWMFHTPSEVGEDFGDEPRHTLVLGGHTTPLRAMILGYVLGFREFHFHGCDSSLADGHYAYDKSVTDTAGIVETGDGRVFRTTACLALQAEKFDVHAADLKRFDPSVTVTFHGDGLLPHMMRLPHPKETENGNHAR